MIQKKSLTLIEILIVVTIMVALASMVLPRLTGRSEQAKVSIAKSDINANISMALKLYELDNGDFPTTEQGLKALLAKPSSNPVPRNWNGPYIEKEPLDPWGSPYQYQYSGSKTDGYKLYSLGRDGTEGTEDDISNK